MKVLLLLICLILSGCEIKSDYSKRRIDDYLESYCAQKDLQYQNKGIIFEKEIKNIGYYAIAKIQSGKLEKLISIRQDLATKNKPKGFNYTGPTFDGKPYCIYENEDFEYGHGKNYYLYVIDGYVTAATYKDMRLDVEITNYTLNNVDKSLSSFLITLDKTEEINLDLLKYKIN